MPPLRTNSPPEVMSWGKPSAILAVSVSVIFDALRFACEQFWLFGPALAAIYCHQQLSGTLGETIAGAVCATGATALGANASPAFMLFGTVLAMVVGIFGWLVVAAIVVFTNERLLSVNINNVFWLAGSLLVSEIPFIGSVPALTATVIKLYSAQINRDKEILRAYKANAAVTEQEDRDQRTALLLQMQNARAQKISEETYDNMEEGDTEEIPDTSRRAG